MSLSEFEASRDRLPTDVVLAFVDEIFRLKDAEERGDVDDSKSGHYSSY